MGFVNDELQEISQLCQNVVAGSRLISCVRSMVRVEITKTAFKKLVVCVQFPEDYPSSSLLIELKSKTLSAKLLNDLTNICENECKRFLNKAQVLPLLKFIQKFIDETPLICCYEEISVLKGLLKEGDTLKLKQKNSTVILTLHQDSYYFKTKLEVPDNYPVNRVTLTDTDTNLPPLFARYLVAQGNELGRKCIEPPVDKKDKTPFTPSPSLNIVASFLIKIAKALPQEDCQLCKKKCLPEDPKEVTIDENADMHVERLYCGHLFHLQCLITFMKTPPFHGGKKCPECGQQVYHDKWGLSNRLAEERWAHEQARTRELSEVEDFFK